MSALAEIYTIPQEHLDFRDTIRQIAQERVAPRAAEIDEKAEAKITQIHEGTNEIQRLVIARAMR